MRAVRTLAISWVLLTACGGSEPAPDAAIGRDDAAMELVDAYVFTDASGPPDAWLAGDAGTTSDAGTASDAATDSLLILTGECGVLDTELTDDLPHWVQNTSTFDEGFMAAMDATRLSAGAQTILAEGTAGGSSGYSEAFAFEVLHRCEGAELLRTETMIRYSVPMPGSITDILVEIDGMPIGVSVTRAVTVTGMCTRADTFGTTAARDLLMRKLAGINESSTLVSPEHAWVKQILFVYADTETHASVLRSEWEALDASLRADTVLYVSVSEAMDAFVYFEDRCP